MGWDVSKPWYHGSPTKLTWLRIGSTITQDRDLARVFSHKPTLVYQDVDAAGQRILKHNGMQPGYLYRLITPLGAAEIEPHPTSTMEAGQEWLTQCELEVELVEPTLVDAAEVLSEAEVAALYRWAAEQRTT
ncbi:MAG: hypothetical protein DCC57_11095 [Chloroflexi bacterium]|nr:MAG: hypothetical protein DCC57_11095 [Chloroflexota bacterium]